MSSPAVSAHQLSHLCYFTCSSVVVVYMCFRWTGEIVGLFTFDRQKEREREGEGTLFLHLTIKARNLMNGSDRHSHTPPQ